jgi:hypothetical protein
MKKAPRGGLKRTGVLVFSRFRRLSSGVAQPFEGWATPAPYRAATRWILPATFVTSTRPWRA